MALPINQPVPEILRGWTVARSIPAGKDAGGRIIQDLIHPREPIAGARQEIARIEQAIPQSAIRILDELRGLQVALRRSIALKKQARRGLIHRRRHLANLAALGGAFPMRIHRLMPLRECENDVGGRFTKRPLRDSQCRFQLSSVFSSVCASLAGPATPVRKSPRLTGATPLFEAPVRAWRGVGFHNHRPALSGGRSRPFESIPAGRRSRSGSLRIGSGRCPARGQELRPLFHQDAPALEQVRAGIGRFHLIPDFHFGRSSANYRIASDAFIYADLRALDRARRPTPSG